MSTKINLDTDFYDNPKIRQLRIYCGDESPFWLIRLWCYAAKYYPKDGVFLNMERSSIERISGFTGTDGNFIGALERLSLIDKMSENNYKIHDWRDHAGFIWNYHSAGKEGAKRRWKSNRSNNSTPIGTPIGTPNAIELNGIELNRIKTKTLPTDVGDPISKEQKEGPRDVFWKEVIAHMKTTWERKKPGAVFVFGGKEAALLRPQVRAYMAWGVMALWDIYLTTDNDWYRTQGYSVVAFCPAINSLVDNPSWKGIAKKYEVKLCTPIPELEKLLVSKGKVR